jgi:hypothetical protein
MELRRSLDAGNVLGAELAARQIGKITLGHALELTALIALEDRDRGRRAAARWLERWLAETRAPTIDDAAMVVGALASLGGPRHKLALVALQAMSTRATSATGSATAA